VTLGGGACPGRSHAPKMGNPLAALNGIAVAISPVREYAVTLSTGRWAGTANATNHRPSTLAGCRVSTVPSDSSTRAETTSFQT